MSADPTAYLGALARIEIRRGFEQAIKGATLVGDRVHRSRIFPIALHDADGALREGVLPAILVYSGDEDDCDKQCAPEHLGGSAYDELS